MPACVEDVDADGFTKVAAKIRYRAPPPAKAGRKSRKGRSAVVVKDGGEVHDDEQARIAKLKEVIESRRKLLDFGSWAESWEALVRSLQEDSTFPRPTRIVCFGLGSLIQSRIAQLQLLLMLDLAARFEIKNLSAFDPAFTALDGLLLASYGVSLIAENTYGRYPLSDEDQEATLLYMPHCPRALYQNVLASNWTAGRLGRVVLLANELDGYLTRDPLPKLEKIAPCVPRVAPHLTCRLLPNSFHYNDVYNDLAIQWVRPADVALVGSSEKGWEEPVAEIDGIGDEVL